MSHTTQLRQRGHFVFYRLIIGVGLFTLGYYIGREVGRTEHVRRELEQARQARIEETEPTVAAEEPAAPAGET